MNIYPLMSFRTRKTGQGFHQRFHANSYWTRNTRIVENVRLEITLNETRGVKHA